jgi:type IV secretory pathway VirB9-like protein
MEAKLIGILILCLLEFLVNGCSTAVPLPRKEAIYCPKTPMLPHKTITIYCKPLFLTDVDFEAESIGDVCAGDTQRWLFQTINSVDNHHLLIKPKETHIATNALVVTTHGTYHLSLVANDKKYGQGIYRVVPKQCTPINLDFNYSLINQSSWFKPMPKWAPLYVYNDGDHVYIEMPLSIKNQKAPILYELDSNQEPNLVNYSVKNGNYVVEHLFDQALLLSHEGNTEQKIIIKHR